MLLLQTADEFEDVFLDGDIQGGGRFVGDEQFRVAAHGHGNHNALFLTAGEFVRVRVENLGGPWQHYFFEQVYYLLFCFFFADMFVQDNLFGNLFTAADDWIE